MPSSSTKAPPDRDDLNDAQRRLVDAALSADTGLFVQSSVPGSGKTYAGSRLAAEYVVRRAAAGVARPTAGLAVTAFNRDAANDLLPEITEWIQWLVHTDATDAGARLTAADADEVIAALRRSSTVGTIDAVLQRVFDDVAPELGFDPDVRVVDGHAADRLHASAFEAVTTDPNLAAAVERLRTAYPQRSDDDDDRVASILETVFKSARDQRWDGREVGRRLREGRDACYPDGPPASLADIERDIRRFDDTDAELRAADLAHAPDAVVDADRRLYAEWGDRIDDLVAVYRAYVAAYDRVTRERNVMSHIDRAYWVARYFDDPECAHRHADDGDHHLVAARRDRLRERWRSRIDLLVVDEAQDVSAGQHAALTPLVTDDARVVLYGDPFQTIYTWRNASPTLFGQAIADGEYLGHQWDTHEVEPATTTYRQRPALARLVNGVFGPALTDDSRGVDPAVGATYEALDPVRDDTDEPHVHVPTFTPTTGATHISNWHNPRDGEGSAGALATYIRGALSAGQFGDPDDCRPIQMLLRGTNQLDAIRDAFETNGLSVGVATPVFAAPLASAVVALFEWLVDPTDEPRTRRLLTASAFANAGEVRETLAPTIEDHEWDVHAAAAAEACDGVAATVLQELATLATDTADRRRQSASALARRVCRLLDPHTDPLGFQPDATPEQRLRVRDALVEEVASLDGADVRFPTVVERLAAIDGTPGDGPDLAVDTAAHDVVFRTVHTFKGDEAGVVALADPAQDARYGTAYRNSVVAHGETLAVCPPDIEDATGASTQALCAYNHGLFAQDTDQSPAQPPSRSSGLRWATNRIRTDDPTATRFAGPAPFAAVAAANRAEHWRVGYVAATRARDHLVVPVERRDEWDPTRSWSHALGSALGVGSDARKMTRSVTVDGSAVLVSENDAPGRSPLDTVPELRPRSSGRPRAAPTQIGDGPRREWLPRFLNPSTFAPLVDDHERYVLDHLLHAQLDTESGDLDPDLGLDFETVPPGRVGRIAHDTIASAVREGVSERTLRQGGDAAMASIEWACRRDEREFGAIPDDERASIMSYLATTILPQFAASALFDRIAAADAVFVEEPLETVVRVDGADVEVRGQADFVLRDGDRWRIEDLKVAFADGTDETDERYRVQLATYRWVLAKQEGVDPTSIDASVNSLGSRVGSVVTVGDEYDGARVAELLERLGSVTSTP
ncbi:UvrD-helicase domain-containing protein [Halobaculum marinum]|uniref:UvrD-helicase domain-containing protein n=1 Tax=Halobaculum marinum TaxID=3031996 RepID=A0ABD5WU46_9EURY|nr:UvrD-helicase domain-containing protein [Halobaculum sp. DT55]